MVIVAALINSSALSLTEPGTIKLLQTFFVLQNVERSQIPACGIFFLKCSTKTSRCMNVMATLLIVHGLELICLNGTWINFNPNQKLIYN